MQPERRVAIVTGAGSGIGRAIAVEAAARGMHVVLVGRRVDALEETRARIGEPHADIVAGDVTVAHERSRLRDEVGRRHGRVDLLVNNAGVVASGPLERLADGDLERLVAVNVVAPAALARTLLPLLRRAAPSRIVNVGSMFGDLAFPYFAAYSATKFALRGLSDALRRELACDAIGVTYAAPRATRTPAADGFARLVGPMRMKLDAPEEVARRILDGAARGARTVYPRGPERLFVLLQRLVPAAIDRNLEALARDPAVIDAVAAER